MLWALLAMALAAEPGLELDGALDVCAAVGGHEQPSPVEVRAGETVRVRLCSPGSADTAPVRWYALVAAPGDYDNVGRAGPAPIRYRWAELGSLRGRAAFDLQQVPELASEGTHRLVAARAPLPAEIETAAFDDVARLFSVVLRRDDSYVGRLTELIGTPFVLWPRSLPGLGHQTDARIAADCVALVIYGRRRLGEAVPYVSPTRLRRSLELVARHDPSRPLAGEIIPIQPGDVLHFGFQTAVVARDNPPLGALDPTDVIIHTYHGLAEERAFGDLPYRSAGFDVYRWPAAVHASR